MWVFLGQAQSCFNARVSAGVPVASAHAVHAVGTGLHVPEQALPNAKRLRDRARSHPSCSESVLLTVLSGANGELIRSGERWQIRDPGRSHKQDWLYGQGSANETKQRMRYPSFSNDKWAWKSPCKRRVNPHEPRTACTRENNQQQGN